MDKFTERRQKNVYNCAKPKMAAQKPYNCAYLTFNAQITPLSITIEQLT